MKKLFKILFVSLILITGCNNDNNSLSNYKDEYEKDKILELKFNEGSGTIIHDSKNRVEAKQMSYVYTESATLKTSVDNLAWSNSAVEGKSILFDGYSTWLDYGQEVRYKGNKLSVSAWVAPRNFEWDNVDAVENDNEYLTGVVSSFYHSESINMGFILGYHREGKWSFQCGTGTEWYEVWDEGTPLQKYQWNYMTAVFDGDEGNISIYLNGKIVNRKVIPAGSSIAYSSIDLLIGKSNDSKSSGSCVQGVVSGLVDNVTIYDTAISNNYIRETYKRYSDNLAIDFNEIFLQTTLSNDKYKTQYHGGPNEHWMNEPHAPIYYKGVYHLFFQHQINGPYFNGAAGIVWGHLVSEDMVNWRQIKEAITFDANSVCPDGVWSGGSTYATVNGVDDVPVLLFTAGNYKHEGLISNQNIGLATPKDPNDPYLTEWEVSDKLAIAQQSGQGQAGEFRDAHVWIEGDTYYLLVGSSYSGRGTALLYTTTKNTKDAMHNWTYRGRIFDWPEQIMPKYGTTWELPVMLPLKDKNGNTTNKYVFAISPAPATTADNNIVYWIGEFDKQNYRFIPDEYGEPKRMDYGRNCFTGPSGFIDPVSGQAVMFSIMQDQRDSGALAASGWANCVGLGRYLYLDSENNLRISPIQTLNNYKQKLIELNNPSLSTIQDKLQEIFGDNLCIEFTYKMKGTNDKFILNVKKSKTTNEYTQFYHDGNSNLVGANTNMATKYYPYVAGDFTGYIKKEDEMSFELYIDRSLNEAFFNKEKTISCRSYEEANDALGVEFFVEGEVEITSFKISKIKSIY